MNTFLSKLLTLFDTAKNTLRFLAFLKFKFVNSTPLRKNNSCKLGKVKNKEFGINFTIEYPLP